jgi:hypothetical protein
MPEAKTPGTVIVGLAAIFVAMYLLFSWTFESWTFWGPVITLLVAAFSTTTWTQFVEEFHALTVLNRLTGKQRAIFQGRTGKLPWEQAGTSVDLKAELKDILEETWATDKGALMKTKYIYLLRPRTTEIDIIKYAGYEASVIKAAARNLFSQLFSDHFGQTQDPTMLLNKTMVNTVVLESADGLRRLGIFEDQYGVEAWARLEDVDFDDETQKARSTVSRAEAIAQAFDELENKVGKEEATKIVKMMNIEGVQEWILTAPDLKNLQSATFIGAPSTTGKGGKK